jgi:hypothetical protein
MSRMLFPAAALLLVATLAAAQPGASPRITAYEIDVALDPEAHTLEGHQVLAWTNTQEQPTGEIPFHLYWNAWRNNRSTWMREDRLRRRNDLGEDVRPGDWSWIEVDVVRLLPADGSEPVDLRDAAYHAAPDDGNQDDRTVLVVPLPAPVAPGETVRLEMAFRARVPRTFARTGYRGDTYLLAHWYPIPGVLEPGGWNCHQFHASTEFFADFGTFDVRLTVPEAYVVGATGEETERRENDDGTVTYRFVQDDVHNFAWTASPRYLVRERTFEAVGLPPVKMRLLLQPEHASQAERYLDATDAALEHYGTWYGPYPYGHVTVVDPAYGAGHGGMEYPTLFTGGTRLFAPFGGDRPESVTIHEAGHQFWYGLVGNNEFEHAWIDEGLNTYSTLRTLDVVYGARELTRRYLSPPGAPRRGDDGFLVARFPTITVDRWRERANRYRDSATSDVPSTESYRYFPATGPDITYSKTALWLRTLENYLGWDTFQPVMAAFFERGRFAHPEPDDFVAVAEAVSGRDLRWFFDEVLYSDAAFDYSVTSAVSEPAVLEGYADGEDGPVLAPEPDEDEEPALFRTEVVVKRLGAGRFPVEVLLVFEDGTEIREAWDGRERWHLLVHEGPSKLRHAVVDPEGILALDVNRTNNSRLREPAPELAARKWGGKWMIWFQDLLQTFAFFG